MALSNRDANCYRKTKQVFGNGERKKEGGKKGGERKIEQNILEEKHAQYDDDFSNP